MREVNQPVSWWGWHWTPPVPMSILEIIRAGSMPARLAAMLWVAIERGASLIVAADPPSAGKTTTLTSLLTFAPPEAVAYFTRGIGESFDLPSTSDAHPTYLLVNEMSDHLPVYTWGPYARRSFELLAEGYSLATTMHADSVAEVIAIIEEELGLPRPLIANLTFIIPLYIGQHTAPIRRLAEVAFLRPHTRHGLAVRTLARWNADSDSFSLFESPRDYREFALWADLSPPELSAELDSREEFLLGLLDSGEVAIPAVHQAVNGYYRRVLIPQRDKR